MIVFNYQRSCHSCLCYALTCTKTTYIQLVTVLYYHSVTVSNSEMRVFL